MGVGGREPATFLHFVLEDRFLKLCASSIEPVNAKLFKGNNIVLAGRILQFFELGFQAFLCALQTFDGEALRTAGLEFFQSVGDLVDLVLQQTFLPFL